MHRILLAEIVKQSRAGLAQGDCRFIPAPHSEMLEEALVQLWDDALELRAEIAQLRAEREWRPIETADRTSSERVDIWIVPPGKTVSEGHRVQNCRPAGQNAWVDDMSIGGQFVTGRYFYDDDGDQCLDPDDISVRAFRATHWQPLLAPPEATP